MFTKFNCVYCLTQQKTNTHYNQYSLFQAAWALFYCLYSCDFEHSEEVVQRFSVKEVFFEITQNSQENTCVGLSFQ